MNLMEQLASKLPSGIGYDWTGMSYQERLSGTGRRRCTPSRFWWCSCVWRRCMKAGPCRSRSCWYCRWGYRCVAGRDDARHEQRRVLPVGLLTTIGLSAKNAILIVEFAKDLMEKEGKGLIEATLEAVRMRLRPILMTSLAFILGVLPLVISSGAGSGAQNAVGTGVMGGMITATVLAIFFVPVFFVVVRRRFSKKNEDRNTAIR